MYRVSLCVRLSTRISPSDLHNHLPVLEELAPFHKEGNRGSREVFSLAEVTQQISLRAEI